MAHISANHLTSFHNVSTVKPVAGRRCLRWTGSRTASRECLHMYPHDGIWCVHTINNDINDCLRNRNDNVWCLTVSHWHNAWLPAPCKRYNELDPENDFNFKRKASVGGLYLQLPLLKASWVPWPEKIGKSLPCWKRNQFRVLFCDVRCALFLY